MGTPKLTGFLIGFVLITLAASVFGLYLTNLSNGYSSTTTSFDNSSMSKYSDKMADITNQTEIIRDRTQVDAQSSWTDILGGYFGAAYRTVRVSMDSFGLFNERVDSGIDDAAGDSLGAALSPFKTALTTILLILVFVGIFIAIMVKWHTI